MQACMHAWLTTDTTMFNYCKLLISGTASHEIVEEDEQTFITQS